MTGTATDVRHGSYHRLGLSELRTTAPVLLVLGVSAPEMARVHHLADLPDIAAHPAVSVAYGLDLELSHCEVCAQSCSDVPPGRWRISWRFAPGKPEHTTDVCGKACGEDELSQLIGWKGICDITLNVPALYFLPSGPRGSVETPPIPVDIEGDEIFNVYHDLKLFVQTMVNTATDEMTGPEGFRLARNRVLEAITSLGINRAEQLRRSA